MRRGGALPMVLLSIGIVTALSIGGSFVSRQYGSDTHHFGRAAAVESAAEAALVAAAGRLDSTVLGLPLGVGVQLATNPFGATAEPVTSAWVTRLSGTVFALVSSASTTSKPMIYKRLQLTVLVDTAGTRPAPYGAWSRLP
jgi:hypothetical protein